MSYRENMNMTIGTICWRFSWMQPNMAGTDRYMQRQVVDELGPAIGKAQEHFEFEVAGRLAGGGKLLAAELKDKSSFEKYGQQMEEFEQSAKITKQARAAAKTLISRP